MPFKEDHELYADRLYFCSTGIHHVLVTDVLKFCYDDLSPELRSFLYACYIDNGAKLYLLSDYNNPFKMNDYYDVAISYEIENRTYIVKAFVPESATSICKLLSDYSIPVYDTMGCKVLPIESKKLSAEEMV